MPQIKDYNDLFDDYDAKQARELARLPKCFECGEPIQDEECYELDEERLVCPECLFRYYRRNTEDFTRDY